MSKRTRAGVVETKRTTICRRERRRSEGGDTLVEVLLALTVLGLASVALLIGFGTSITASGEHRNLALYNTVLATASQEAISAIDAQSSLFVDACSTPVSAYPDYSTGFPLPAPYSSYDVTYVATNPVQYWNGNSYGPATWNSTTSSYPTPPCYNNVPQMITIGFTAGGDLYTNSFVVQYPVTQKNSFSGDSTSRRLVLLNGSTLGEGPSGGPSYAGSPFTVQPIVEVVDAAGIPVTTDLSPVTLAVTSGPGAIAGCSGNEVLGVVTFTGCEISLGGNYQITAYDGSLQSSPSSTFTVDASSYNLVFTEQPIAGASGSAFTQVPQVSVVSSALPSVVDTGWAGTITLTDSGGTLSNCAGSTTTAITVPVTAGVATLPSPPGSPTSPSQCDFAGGYFFDAASSPQVTATHYTMTATANPTAAGDAAVPALSQAFSVTSFGPASQLAFSTEPTGVASGTDTTPFTGQPAVEVEDAYGNLVTSATQATYPVTLAITPGSPTETLSGCTPSVSNGIYTFSGCAGSAYHDNLTLTASSTGGTTSLTSATSTDFNITTVATQLLFSKSPVAENSGSPFAVQPVLEYEDATNNVVTAATSSISLTASGGTLSTCTNLVPTLSVLPTL